MEKFWAERQDIQTQQACSLASLAEINGRKYVLVTAKADGNLFTEGFHVTDAVKVYEQIGKSE